MEQIINEPIQLTSYRDRQFKGSNNSLEHLLLKSSTLYIGNLSYYTTEEQIYELFSKCGDVKRVIMGLDRVKKPHVASVLYYQREDAEVAMRYITSTRLDDRIIRCDWDAGYKEGRQFGRGKSGGQVRDEYRTDYDSGRGGYGKIVQQKMVLSKPKSTLFVTSSVLNNAEKLVNYNPTFLSLSYLLNDELSNIACGIKKLLGTTHPLIQKAKDLFYNREISAKFYGIMVLLISQIFKQSEKFASFHHSNCESLSSQEMDISEKQRLLSEITQMMHLGVLIHQGIVEIKENKDHAKDTQNFPHSQFNETNKGNNLAILIGDYFLANASSHLASLKCPKAVGLLATALTDLMQGQFLAAPSDNSAISEESQQEWLFMNSGSLLAHSLKASLLIENFDEDKQELAFSLGTNIASLFAISTILQESNEVDEKRRVMLCSLANRYKDNALSHIDRISLTSPVSTSTTSLKNIILSLASNSFYDPSY